MKTKTINYRSRKVTCDSGVDGTVHTLCSSYDNFEEFERFCEIFNIHVRAGFHSIKRAWDINPLVISSTIPSDFKRVTSEQALEAIKLYKNKHARLNRHYSGK